MTTTENSGQAGATVRLELPPTTVSIAVGRSVLRRIVTFCDDDAQSSFLVAFTEIISNAIDEHERSNVNAPIVVEVRQAPDEVVRVNDAGSGIPLGGSWEPSTPGVDVERGRGLALARAFVGGLQFESSPAGTTVTLPLAGFGIVR